MPIIVNNHCGDLGGRREMCPHSHPLMETVERRFYLNLRIWIKTYAGVRRTRCASAAVQITLGRHDSISIETQLLVRFVSYTESRKFTHSLCMNNTNDRITSYEAHLSK